MALILADAELITAQDSQTRHPLVEIVSSQNTSDIPFDGQFLTAEATNETRPNVITHSTGRLCQVYTFGSYVKYVYTDVNRQEFNFVMISLPVSHVPIEATLCELANGNIGIIYISTLGAARHLRYMILTPTGVVVTADTLIAAYTTATIAIDMPFVIRLADGTFLLVYHHLTVAGTVYRIEKRTCTADFTSWSAESECSVGGLTATYPKYNPSLMQLSVGDTVGNIFLWFDYRTALTGGVEITNIYYSISTDNGATWAAGVALTTYATTTAVGKHPVSVQKVANEMMMSFAEVRNALYLAPHDAGGVALNMTFDPVGRKLYIVEGNQAGTTFNGVREIDIDSWTETNWWDQATDPAFDEVYTYDGGLKIGTNSRHHGEYPYIPVGLGSVWTVVNVLNVQSNTIISYQFKTYGPVVGHSITKNVTGITVGASEYIGFTWVDAASGRLYVLFFTDGTIRVGYLDIGFYEWHEIIPPTAWAAAYFQYDYCCWVVDVTNDRIVISNSFGDPSANKGKIRTYSISAGGEIGDEINIDDYPDFPSRGLQRITLIGETLIGLQHDYYIADADDRGITVITDFMTTPIITKYQPSWGPYDDYLFRGILSISSTEVAIGSTSYGLTIFDINTHDWQLINNANTPGITPHGSDTFLFALSYDPLQQIIFADCWNAGGVFGVTAVSRYGAFKTTYYRLGTYSAGWTFESAILLTQEWTDYDLVMAINPGLDDLSIYAFWTKTVSGEISIKWDLDSSSIEISDYVVNGTEVKVHRSIDGRPASLSFTCSHGYLFDPQNILSLYSIYLKKGRKLNLRFGELVVGTEYWQQQGIFFVTASQLSYERPNYPVISIEAEDERVFWEQGNIIATEYFETDPLTMLTDLLVTFGDFDAGDIDLPVFDGACVLWFQWLDTTLQDMIVQICERFGYFPRIDVDGKASARKISGDNAVDHVYSDVTKLLKFTPDDSFSDFVNQVIVTGQSHTFIEVLYAEERIQSLNGTVGWWGFQKNFVMYYSIDRSRRCRNPRLKVIETSMSIAFKLAGEIEESISYVDPDDFYCIVTVSAPNLTALLVASIALWVATFFLPLIYCLGGGFVGPCFETNFLKMLSLMTCMMILGSVGNFQYEIWAQPVGKVRQSFQAIANDDELQGLIGKTISQKIDDPLCFTQGQCQLVADFNRDILKFQRNRVSYTKIGDLRDEEGDTLQVPHPYTAQVMTTFVTELTRRYKKAIPDSDDGYFLDDIEGWRIL